jgi:hypothetical protein
MAFDPDAYLSGKTSGEFNPDEYLGVKHEPITTPLKIGADAFGDTVRDEMRKKDWATRNIIGAGSAVTSAWEGLKGLVGQSNPSQVAATRAMATEAPVGRIAGEVAMLAPTLAIPGAATARGAAAIGGVTGGVLTPGALKERAIAAGLGAAGGAAGAYLSRGAGARGSFEPSDAVKAMEREGISLTPGENIGGIVRRFEDRLTSTPFVGDIIEKSRIRGIEDFNKAALRRAEIPGVSAGGEIGQGGLANVRKGLSREYDDVLSRSSANALEPQFVQDLANLRGMVKELPEQEAAQFDKIISREIDKRLAPNGIISGKNLQDAEAALGQQAKMFATSTDAYQRQLGQALKEANQQFIDLIGRSSPANAAELATVRKGWANMKAIQRASSGAGTAEGVFTPSQLHQAIRANDFTKNKRAFSEGDALMQDLSSKGKDVLLSKVPDSGTAGRLMGSLSNPWALAGLPISTMASLPMSILYSRSGQNAANYLVNKGIRPTAEAIRQALAQNPALAGVTAGRLSELAGQQ